MGTSSSFSFTKRNVTNWWATYYLFICVFHDTFIEFLKILLHDSSQGENRHIFIFQKKVEYNYDWKYNLNVIRNFQKNDRNDWVNEIYNDSFYSSS